ncbi:SDR family NAD(P)-dependent oxidoreductase [Paractinoplanes ferrugineus]|uniref:Short-chain dehydrogenase n=1 Tax=Paractinoplanes ferrugineus TaxID=113564 RepID=A0A919J9D7_9ACTN|nr:SDR family NAD(P)-dependent oxidoreductase [Actinoplanes ferrugineus]GIE15099.1 short-chain dehydrogenase [Actinoplanes ferrugineus]
MTNTSTALVTGANKGIGREIARLLAEAGLLVYATARDADRGRPAAAGIAGEVRFLQLDVTDPDSVEAAAARVGELDILVNNAGVMVGGEDPVAATVDDFRRTYATNVFGVLAVTNAFLPALRRSAHPRIVNISSGTGSLTQSAAGVFPGGSGAAYRSSKTALNALTLFYAQALPSFRINALAPGLRRTDLNERAKSADGDPAEAAAGAVRLALLADDGPTGGFFSWDGTTMPW